MRDYETLGHMTEIPEDKHEEWPVYYLPHHAVIKTNGSTSKLRVVFDGSAKTTTGVSLNDAQEIGYKVQDDLFCIIVRFRKHNFVLSADIKKMYRQIQVIPDQRRFQRIIWREKQDDPLKVYELNTVTYGTALAPFLATRTLREIGETNKETHPIASQTIIKDFYVDDLLSGTNTVQEAQDLKHTVTALLKDAGMELCKWASNEPQIVAWDNADNGKELKLDNNSKTLGLLWNCRQDTLRYPVAADHNSQVTKRTILSIISPIFDPLGLVSPATIQAKLILQKLWQLKVHWDESLPQEIHNSWTRFYKELSSLNKLSIPRHALCKSPKKIQIHGFCDASEKAYGACLYLRSTDEQGKHTVKLLCAKSRVAPLKSISLPKLELCGALLLARLYHQSKTALELQDYESYFWSDSMVTLSWIKAPPSNWKIFVANRTTEIQDLTGSNWNHVGSKCNPADIISRGINPAELQEAALWWNGPPWLSQDTENWPLSQNIHLENVPEKRQNTHTLIASVNYISLIEKYSSLTKLIKVTAFCFRFIKNCRTAQSVRTIDALTPTELDQATVMLLKIAQGLDFKREIEQLNREKEITKTSNIRGLNPFSDKQGLLRVGGRLNNASIPFDQKHPIILGSKNRLTRLIIQNEHERLLHAGCQAVLASIRMKYWPLSATRTIKGLLRQCIRCFRANPTGTAYIMGDLPASRVNPAPIFYSTGVDYAGPFYLKGKPRSKVTTKAFICIFICFAVKAVHIELATSLSTESFLNCYRRFIARRGLCRHLHSDNGTNFIGARNELNELKTLFENETHNTDIANFLAQQAITWHLIPPAAPHFGGLWESAVKSVKNHLKQVVGETKLTYEEFYIILTQIEACLNSRPLSPLSDDPNDLTPLTPGHFLIGNALTSFPEPNLLHIKENRLNRYQQLVQMVQHFWQRWQSEYLHQLQQRTKWNIRRDDGLKPGTMVIIRDNNLPPLRWRMERIMELHPGKDNVTRVVSIKVSD